MQWHELYPKDKLPSEDEISGFITGEPAKLFSELTITCQQRWKAKSKLSYSTCSGKPGWNLKLHKSGKTLATLYPEEGSFSVFLVVPYSASVAMQTILPDLGTERADLYRNADDFMKAGKWMMFSVADRQAMEDCLKIISVKMEA